MDAEVDRTYVGGIERQEFNPTIDILDRLANALSVDVAEFLAPISADAAPPEPLKPGRRSKV